MLVNYTSNKVSGYQESVVSDYIPVYQECVYNDTKGHK